MRHQSLRLRLSPRTYSEDIAPARTFGFLREVETLRRHGLALGGSLDNAVVIGETGVLNSKLRFEDEFVRHKILDAVGDLALLGYPLVGQLEATKAGHALHAAVARKLVETPGASRLVTSPGLPASASRLRSRLLAASFRSLTPRPPRPGPTSRAALP